MWITFSTLVNQVEGVGGSILFSVTQLKNGKCYEHKTLKLLTYFCLKDLWKFSCSCHISFLRNLKSTSQIPINFHTEVDKIEFFITVTREIVSAWIFDHLFIITREDYRIDVSILFDDVTIHDALLKPKKKFLTHWARHSASAFDFHEKWRPATLNF